MMGRCAEECVRRSKDERKYVRMCESVDQWIDQSCMNAVFWTVLQNK